MRHSALYCLGIVKLSAFYSVKAIEGILLLSAICKLIVNRIVTIFHKFNILSINL
jgi:hypothetical protein